MQNQKRIKFAADHAGIRGMVERVSAKAAAEAGRCFAMLSLHNLQQRELAKARGVVAHELSLPKPDEFRDRAVKRALRKAGLLNKYAPH